MARKVEELRHTKNFVKSEMLWFCDSWFLPWGTSRKSSSYELASINIISFTDEYNASISYFKIFRSLITECYDAQCLVFINSRKEATEICRSQHEPNCAGTFRLTANKKGIPSRIPQRAQITALWNKSEDPSWRMRVADQTGYSFDTARLIMFTINYSQFIIQIKIK